MVLRQVKYLKLFRGPQVLSVCSGPSGHVVSGFEEIVALDRAYEERWRADSIGIEQGAFVTADVVVLSSAGVGLRGLAVNDGRQLWQKKTRFSWNHFLAGDVVFALQKEHEPTLSSWSLGSGAPLGRTRLPGYPAGQASGGLLVCCVRNKGGKYVRRVVAVSLSGDGQPLWSTPLSEHYERRQAMVALVWRATCVLAALHRPSPACLDEYDDPMLRSDVRKTALGEAHHTVSIRGPNPS